jgi:hypothetical protein
MKHHICPSFVGPDLRAGPAAVSTRVEVGGRAPRGWYCEHVLKGRAKPGAWSFGTGTLIAMRAIERVARPCGAEGAQQLLMGASGSPRGPVVPRNQRVRHSHARVEIDGRSRVECSAWQRKRLVRPLITGGEME